MRLGGAVDGASQSSNNDTAQIMPATESSTKTEKRRNRARSSPPDREAPPSPTDGDDLAGVMGAYLDVFSRPPLGDHPEIDGYVAGRVLAEQYPEAMQRVMSGYRQGIKDATESAQRAGGQRDE